MRLLKKTIAVIVAACLILALFPVAASALTEGQFEYKVLGDGTVEITGYVLNYSGPLNIPEKLGGKTVSSIGYAAFVRYGMNSLTLPAGVKKIGEHAFAECANLASVALNQGLQSIPNRAFEKCPQLAGITIPKGVTSIDHTAFNNCPIMTAIDVDGANTKYSSTSGVLYDKAQAKLVRCPEGKAGALALPGTVKNIETQSFFQCKALTGVTMQNGVKTIGEEAFYGCEKLASVSLPLSLTSIGNWAFGYCTSLTGITLPAGVTSIGTVDFFNSGGNSLFHYCSNLAAINVDGANTAFSSVAGVLYDKAQTKMIRCPEGKTGALALPSTVKETVPLSALNCKKLTGVTLSSKVATIGMDSFAFCVGLTSVTLPASVKKIDARGFSDCTKLKEAHFLGNAPTLGNDVFYAAASGFTVYYLPGKTGWTTPKWKGYRSVMEGTALSKAVISSVASTGYNSLKISWKKVKGATAYEIQRSTSKTSGFKKAATVSGGSTLSYADKTGLTTGKTYYYKVRACVKVNGQYVYGPLSAVKSGKPIPAVPSGIKAARASSKSIKISWDKVAGASGYEVRRDTSKKGKFSTAYNVTPGSAKSYTNKSLTKGKTYYYKVRAYRKVGGKKIYGGYTTVVFAKP